MEVQFLKTGHPFFFNPYTDDFWRKRMTKEEYTKKTNELRPPPFVPFSVKCRRIIRKTKDYLDVETCKKIFLSNSNGPTADLRFYRLLSNGDVMYFMTKSGVTDHHVAEGTLEPEKWNWNVPKWSFNSSKKVSPLLNLILLGARFDEKSFFGKMSMDIVRLILKKVFETRFDPIWVFVDEETKIRRRRKKLKTK